MQPDQFAVDLPFSEKQYLSLLAQRVPSSLRKELIDDLGIDLQRSHLTSSAILAPLRTYALSGLDPRELHFVLGEVIAGFYCHTFAQHDPAKLLYICSLYLYYDFTHCGLPPGQVVAATGLLLSACERAQDDHLNVQVVAFFLWAARLVSDPQAREEDPRPYCYLAAACLLSLSCGKLLKAIETIMPRELDCTGRMDLLMEQSTLASATALWRKMLVRSFQESREVLWWMEELPEQQF